MGLLEIIKYGPPDERAPLSRRLWVAGDVRGVSGRERGNTSEGPMLAEGRTVPSPGLARVVLVFAVTLLFLGFLAPPAHAVNPTWVTNPNSTRTVTWSMDDPTALTLDRVNLTGGRAILPWEGQNLTWTRMSDASANGTLGPGMTANATGLGLRGNWTNTVQNPTFSSGATWQFANGSGDNVSAGWNASLATAELNASWGGDQVLWDSMDSVAPRWTGSGAAIVQNTTTPQPRQGSGSMGIEVTPGGVSSVSAVNTSLTLLNWSAYDRMVLWIYQNTTLAASFNVTAHVGLGSTVVTTIAEPLKPSPGWQEVTVDLDQLGDASTRSTLLQIVLRFNAATSFPLGTWFDVDDVRLGTAQLFDETATVSQSILKTNATTPLPGSGRLSFAYNLLLSGNATIDAANVSLGGFVSPLALGTPTTWGSFSADVSAAAAAAGSYTLRFGFRVAVNTTGAYKTHLLVDNVTLVFPQMANSTYFSRVLTMGQASQYLNLLWAGTTPSSTGVSVGVRSGNASVPTPPDWGPWQTITAPVQTSLSIKAALRFQIQINLNTTNASESPVVQSLRLATRHRASSGNVTADIFHATGYLWWRTFSVNETLPSNTSIQFEIGDGSSGTPVQPGENLTSYAGGPNLTWQANLLTTDGLQTPSLFNVTFIYDFQGPPARVIVSQGQTPLGPNDTLQVTAGDSISLAAAVYDSGYHRLPATLYPVAWSIDNASGGSVVSNGTYEAGRPGIWHVIATVVGTTVYASVRVNVTASSGSTSLPATLWDYWPVLLVLGAGMLGFSVYELVIRRMFAIDDVFLIAKDGRLILHNTRRMRADRDEDILSGMLTAIMAFIRDSDPEENGELKRFAVGGKTTLLERGKHVYLSAIYSGRVPGWAAKDLHHFMADLEDRFGEAFATWSGSPEDLHDVKEYMRRFVTRVRYRGDPNAHHVEN